MFLLYQKLLKMDNHIHIKGCFPFAYLLHEGPRNAGDINTVLDQIRPLLTRLSRVQIPKKTITEAKNLILHQTFLLEIGESDLMPSSAAELRH